MGAGGPGPQQLSGRRSQVPAVMPWMLGAITPSPPSSYLLVGSNSQLGPLLQSLQRCDLTVRNVSGHQAQQTLQNHLRTIVHKVLLRGQLGQVILLRMTHSIITTPGDALPAQPPTSRASCSLGTLILRTLCSPHLPSLYRAITRSLSPQPCSCPVPGSLGTSSDWLLSRGTYTEQKRAGGLFGGGQTAGFSVA